MNKPIPTVRSPWRSRWGRGLLAAAVVAGAWLGSATLSQARAGDIYWSVGVHSPGVHVGVSNAPTVIYAPPVVAVRTVPAPVRWVTVRPGWGPPDWRDGDRRHDRGHHHGWRNKHGGWKGDHDRDQRHARNDWRPRADDRHGQRDHVHR